MQYHRSSRRVSECACMWVLLCRATTKYIGTQNRPPSFSSICIECLVQHSVCMIIIQQQAKYCSFLAPSACTSDFSLSQMNAFIYLFNAIKHQREAKASTHIILTSLITSILKIMQTEQHRSSVCWNLVDRFWFGEHHVFVSFLFWFLFVQESGGGVWWNVLSFTQLLSIWMLARTAEVVRCVSSVKRIGTNRWDRYLFVHDVVHGH